MIAPVLYFYNNIMINQVPYCAWIILTVPFLVCSVFPIVLGDSIIQETIKKVRMIIFALNKCILLNLIQLGMSIKRRDTALQKLAKISFVNEHIILCV